MFWKSLLYNVALWMCPPVVCGPEVVCEATPFLARTTPNDVMLACPQAPCPPTAPCCPVAAVPRKTYSAQFRFTEGHPVCIMTSAEEGAFSYAAVTEPGSNPQKGMVLVSRLGSDCGGKVRVDCALDVKGEKKQQYRAGRTVVLDKESALVFKCPDGESIRAEVTVREVPQFAMPAPVAMPTPVAALPCTPACPAPQVCMPAPMPVASPTCTSTPAYPAQQVVMPAPMPVGYPLPAPVMPVTFRLPEPMPMPVPSVAACTSATPQLACNAPCPCPPSVQRCSAVTTPKTMSLLFIRHDNTGMMSTSCSDGSSEICQRRTLKHAAAGKLALSAGKTCLHVKGADWKAYAEQIDVRQDGQVVLKGNVRLSCDKLGVCATVKAEELRVEVKKGKFDKFVTK